MGSIVTGMKTSAWVSIGLVLLLGPSPLGTSVEVHPQPRPKVFPQPKLQVKDSPEEVRIEIPGDALFDFNKRDIRPDAEPILRQATEIIQQQYPKAAVAIKGYTDVKGSDRHNLQLSEQRAQSVKAWLIQQGGVDGKRITTEGKGEADPIAPNTYPDGSDNPEGRQKNRRVEITVKK
jgi:outer membrane protein OmpA-like peptidoglycan-associated protein